jgi:hypothetical protein
MRTNGIDISGAGGHYSYDSKQPFPADFEDLTAISYSGIRKFGMRGRKAHNAARRKI